MARVRCHQSLRDLFSMLPTKPVTLTFGHRDPTITYIQRPSAYVVVQDEQGHIATTLSPNGHFLPGGGIDKGETAEAAATREAREECGFLLRDLHFLCEANEFVRSRKYKKDYEKQCVFFTAEIAGMTQPTETTHHLIWLAPEQAIAALTQEGHSYAVERFLEVRR